MVTKLFIPIIVEVEAELGRPSCSLAFSRPPSALLAVAQTNCRTAIERRGDGPEAGCEREDVFMNCYDEYGDSYHPKRDELSDAFETARPMLEALLELREEA